MRQNLVALSINISRAYEVAKAGNHSIAIKPGKQADEEGDKAMTDNCNTLIDFYGAMMANVADIVVELHTINANDIFNSYTGRYETKEDIDKRAEECKKSDLVPEIHLTGANNTLLKSAINRLGLSIRQVNSILAVSITIAKLSKSNTVKVEHLAEAIQYQSA